MEKFIKVLRTVIKELETDQLRTVSLLNEKHDRIIIDVKNNFWTSHEEYIETLESYNQVRAQIQILEEVIEELEEVE
jgi:hypothetical protein